MEYIRPIPLNENKHFLFHFYYVNPFYSNKEMGFVAKSCSQILSESEISKFLPIVLIQYLLQHTVFYFTIILSCDLCENLKVSHWLPRSATLLFKWSMETNYAGVIYTGFQSVKPFTNVFALKGVSHLLLCPKVFHKSHFYSWRFKLSLCFLGFNTNQYCQLCIVYVNKVYY